MKVKPGYVLIYNDVLLYAENPLLILQYLCYEELQYRNEMYGSFGIMFVDWLDRFLTQMRLFSSLKKFNRFLKKLSDKEKTDDNDYQEVLELADYILNELHYTKYPYFVYGKIDETNVSSLKDILTALTMDRDLANTTYTNIITEINNTKDNVKKFRIRRYISDEAIIKALSDINDK